MNEASTDDSPKHHADMSQEVARKEARKIRARRQKDLGIWGGLGTFGLIGWSVALPVLLCLAVGIWLDRTWPSGFSWTLLLLMAGIMLGCLNAWYWLSQERRMIERANGNDDRNA